LDETHNELDPLVIIECKAPEVILSSTDIDQVQGYADRLSADYCVLVKDSRTIVLQIYLHPVILFTGGFIKI
ncbi:MAG: type I restriction enzyme HsdR N-terminal domain-containing protein, partial [Lachnospiraceae bacterium]|uniref:type I restriction enzyme HsdR N-terminal domain-containing protein n=1 Tax=Galactobacillus timonensis TaxID=2041840 RepID=UPI0023EF6EFC